MRIGICDDVKDEQEETKNCLYNNCNLKEEDEVTLFFPEDIRKAVKQDIFDRDVLILDIDFVGRDYDGIKLGALINKYAPECYIIFLTNFLEYAQSYKKDSWKMKPDCRNQWLADSEIPSKMVHIDVPLRMRGGISIRRYASKKGEPDFVHITDHGVPIIPGSSLAGVLRHRIVTILWDMKMAGIKLPENINKMVDIAFGYVHGDYACASNIIIGETEIKNARPLTMVRTGVSRFESAVKQGTLYKEKTYVDGNLNIHIMVRKSEHPADEKWILGLLLLAIKDLQNGLLAVGGQTAIGRGIFEKQGPIVIDGKEGIEDAVIGELLKNMVEKGEVC